MSNVISFLKNDDGGVKECQRKQRKRQQKRRRNNLFSFFLLSVLGAILGPFFNYLR
jgi:hypothetical protein